MSGEDCGAYVRWLDAWKWADSGPEIVSLTEFPRETVGFLVEETEDLVTIAQTRDHEGFHELLSIPRGMIVTVLRFFEPSDP